MTSKIKRKPAPKWDAEFIQDDPTEVPRKAQRRSKAWKLVNLSTVKPVTVKWLWYPYIPRGRITAIEGDPGAGKSWFTCAVAAALSTGTLLPGMQAQATGNTLMLSVEDGLADTIVPRLISLGSDLTKISVPNVAAILDQDGMQKLEDTIQECKASLVIIDPYQYYIGGKLDINTANQVRSFTAPLHITAERTNAAIVVVRHLNKNVDGKSLYRGLGSIDFAASVRSILQVVKGDEPGQRIANHIKCNNAPEGMSISYSIIGSQFEWGELVEYDGSAAKQKGGKIENAIAFIKNVLESGEWVSVEEIKQRAKDETIGDYFTIAKAKEKVEGIETKRDGGKWWWRVSREA